jgi:hypothetical protein
MGNLTPADLTDMAPPDQSMADLADCCCLIFQLRIPAVGNPVMTRDKAKCDERAYPSRRIARPRAS